MNEVSTQNKMRTIGQTVLGLTFIALVLWGLVALVRWMWSVLISADPTFSAGMVAASATIIVSICSVLVSKYLEQRAAVTKEHRERKIPVYEELLRFLFKILMSEKPGQKAMSEKEMIGTFSILTQKIMVWASDAVVKSFSNFRQVTLSTENPENSVAIAVATEDLLLAIRKDLGHKNQGLKRGTLLRLFLNDIDSFLKIT